MHGLEVIRKMNGQVEKVEKPFITVRELEEAAKKLEKSKLVAERKE
jgi:hypothetical protein